MDSTYANQTACHNNQIHVKSHQDSLCITIAKPTGQSDQDNVWGMTSDIAAIVIPTAATILVFIAGIIVDRIYKRIQSINETRIYKKIVYEWIDCISETANKQICRLSSLSENIISNRTLQAVRFEFSKSMANKLDIISASKVLKYFVFNSTNAKGESNKKYAFNIISQFDYLSSAENEIVKMYELYNQQSYALLKPWNNAIIEIGKIVGSTPLSQEVELYNELCKLYEKWSKTLDDEAIGIDIITTKEIFIEPLASYLLDNGKFASLPMFGRLLNNINALQIVLKQWYALSNGYEQNFRGYIKSYTASLELLVQAKTALEKTWAYK